MPSCVGTRMDSGWLRLAVQALHADVVEPQLYTETVISGGRGGPAGGGSCPQRIRNYG
jgi:hypothetical protein